MKSTGTGTLVPGTSYVHYQVYFELVYRCTWYWCMISYRYDIDITF